VPAFVAGAVAAVVGGAPSTIWALLTDDDPRAPTLAAGSLVAYGMTVGYVLARQRR